LLFGLIFNKQAHSKQRKENAYSARRHGFDHADCAENLTASVPAELEKIYALVRQQSLGASLK
jgi:hypothetical protein